MSEKVQVCKALAALVRKGGEPDVAEVNFVASAAMELGLEPKENEDVQKILKEGGDYEKSLEGVQSKAMKTYLFRRVVSLTLLDEKIEDDELKLIFDTAKAFSFKEEAVRKFIGWTEEGIAWEKRGIAIMGEF